MRTVIQRVSQASVKVDGQLTGSIEKGYLILVGFSQEDDENVLDQMIHKIIDLRIFEDENGKMNLSILDVGGTILSVSQFTLYADCRHGRRPSFTNAKKADEARNLYALFNQKLSQFVHVETGIFQADMKVSLLNDGPVTIILDSEELKR